MVVRENVGCYFNSLSLEEKNEPNLGLTKIVNTGGKIGEEQLKIYFETKVSPKEWSLLDKGKKKRT